MKNILVDELSKAAGAWEKAVKDVAYQAMNKASDFSRVEKRILDNLKKANRGGAAQRASALLDLHRMRAAVMYGCMYSVVSPEQRRNGKARNFWNLYSDRPEPVITEEQFKLIYSASELKQIAVDIGWSASSGNSLYETLNHYFKLGA